jgi:hypothetical protein
MVVGGGRDCDTYSTPADPRRNTPVGSGRPLLTANPQHLASKLRRADRGKKQQLARSCLGPHAPRSIEQLTQTRFALRSVSVRVLAVGTFNTQQISNPTYGVLEESQLGCRSRLRTAELTFAGRKQNVTSGGPQA